MNTVVDYALACTEPQVTGDLARLLCLLVGIEPHRGLPVARPRDGAGTDHDLSRLIGRACLLMHERCEFEVERAIVQLGLLRMAS